MPAFPYRGEGLAFAFQGFADWVVVISRLDPSQDFPAQVVKPGYGHSRFRQLKYISMEEIVFGSRVEFPLCFSLERCRFWMANAPQGQPVSGSRFSAQFDENPNRLRLASEGIHPRWGHGTFIPSCAAWEGCSASLDGGGLRIGNDGNAPFLFFGGKRLVENSSRAGLVSILADGGGDGFATGGGGWLGKFRAHAESAVGHQGQRQGGSLGGAAREAGAAPALA